MAFSDPKDMKQWGPFVMYRNVLHTQAKGALVLLQFGATAFMFAPKFWKGKPCQFRFEVKKVSA